MFLGTLVQVADFTDRPLDADARGAMEASLKYFREAAPKHTADEEQSLFPRLRKLQDAEVEAAICRLDPLENEHRRADLLHVEVDRLGRQWLEAGTLGQADAERFRSGVAELASIYKEHIRIEDEVVFPLAGRVLSSQDKAEIAGEMAARRK
jgi:hemerythrin-like domain-containing protein